MKLRFQNLESCKPLLLTFFRYISPSYPCSLIWWFHYLYSFSHSINRKKPKQEKYQKLELSITYEKKLKEWLWNYVFPFGYKVGRFGPVSGAPFGSRLDAECDVVVAVCSPIWPLVPTLVMSKIFLYLFSLRLCLLECYMSLIWWVWV